MANWQIVRTDSLGNRSVLYSFTQTSGPSGLTFIDAPSAGQYTYSLEVQASAYSMGEIQVYAALSSVTLTRLKR